MPPRVFPSTDLHLVVGAEVPLTAFAKLGGTWSSFSAQPSFAMALFPNTAGIVTLTAQRVVAQTVGATHATLRLGWGPGQNVNFALRTTVHHRLRQIVLPTAGFTMEADRTDRVLTVYAQFETAGGVLSTHDVTSLPYLTYNVTVTAGSPTVTVDAHGRVSTTGSSAGTVSIEVSVDPALVASPPTASLQIQVVDAPTDQPILNLIQAGTAIRRRSILVLADGFSSQQQTEFEALARRLAQRMFTVSPYTLLRESFDVYTAFVASQDEGVTFGPPIIPLGGSADVALAVPPDRPLVPRDFLVEELLRPPPNGLGHPSTGTTSFATAGTTMRGIDGRFTLSQRTFDTWRSLTTTPVETRVRETFFGFMMGERHFSSATRVNTPPPPTIADEELDFLFPREANRTPLIDVRRLPDLTAAGADPDTAHVAAQDRFVSTLRAPGGPAGFGAIWASGGESFGLVVYLINSDHYGGVRREGHLAMSIGGGIQVATAPSLLAPGLIDVAPVPRPIIPFFSRASRQGFVNTPSDVLVDTMAHELAHAAALGNLGDEYEERPEAPTSTAAIAFIDSAPNIQTLTEATNGGTAILSTHVKWNWVRVEAAAHVEALAGTGQTLDITTIAEHMLRWPLGTVGRTVFLRHKDLSSIHSPQASGLVIRNVDIMANVIRVDVPLTSSAAAAITLFSTGSTLVLPRVDASNNEVPILDPDVFTAMVGGPFAQSTHAGGRCEINVRQDPPATITGVTFPRNRRQLLAAYESAGQHNCGAIRPAAECKMRRTAQLRTDIPFEFCFVCKYAIVEAVDCSAHAALDGEYPR